MKVSKYEKIGNNVNTKALRFTEDKKVKVAISLSVITDGTKWVDDNKKACRFKILKKADQKFTCSAIVFFKFKLCFVKYNLIGSVADVS